MTPAAAYHQLGQQGSNGVASVQHKSNSRVSFHPYALDGHAYSAQSSQAYLPSSSAAAQARATQPPYPDMFPPSHYAYGSPSVLNQPQRTVSPAMHSSSMAAEAGPSSTSATTVARQESPAVSGTYTPQKSRSAMACVLCRKQKMKCEGPEKAPCKRCRGAGVECVFEAPPAVAPRARGGGPPDAYVEQRFAHVEDRISRLEEKEITSNPSSSVVATKGGFITDHERRIAALEAQVYALQVSVSEVQNQNQLLVAAQANMQQQPQALPQYYPQTFAQYDAKTAMPPVNSTPFDSCYAINGVKPDPCVSGHRDKRQKTTCSGDFISRGLVSEEEAMLCFESYFVTFPHPSGDVSNGANGKPKQDRPIRLPFRETRSRSPLLLATLVSIGARSLSRFSTYKTTLNEAIDLCHDTILCDPGNEPTSLDLKGMMLLSLYNGMPDLMGHGIALSYKFGMPTALLEFEALSPDEQASHKGQVLVRRGRAFLIAFLWTSFYSYCRGLHGTYHIPADVIRHQLDLLEGSDFVQQPFDRGIRVNVEECLILREVFDKIGPGMRAARPSYDELFQIVEQGIQALLDWEKRWLDMMEMITQWGDSRELKTAVPFHHGRQSLLMYIFRNMVIDDRARQYPKMREFAKRGSESALVIMRWGIESRIWLPHSMVAQYLHHVNIPTAINLLYTTTRLFPEDADFPRVRKLLQQCLKQCDLCIAGNNGTEREVERAIETRNIVLEFDRFAFEVGSTYEDDKASVNTAPETCPNSSLFGEEVTASLKAMSLELNLWGGLLEGALDDVYAVPTSL
ncbi:hypothetical protein OIV83_004209 [Microbotryomycetes sp. JL201]|nr:hypothetical protein OIV83_004209 [Microbotryomycetes sp. JL201]